MGGEAEAAVGQVGVSCKMFPLLSAVHCGWLMGGAGGLAGTIVRGL